MRKNIFKTTVIAMAVLTAAFGMTACGSKNTSDNIDTNTETKAVVNETKATEKATESTTKITESVPETEAGKEYETTAEGKLVTDENGKAVEVTTPATEAPTEEVIVADNSDNNNGASYEYTDIPADTSEDTPVEDTGSSDTGNSGPSNTGNKFYDDFMNGGHIEGTEDLIDKDSDPSKPCPHPLNTPIETTWYGNDGDGNFDTYPVYLVYTLCSEDATGGKAAHIVQNMYYGGKVKVNGITITPYISLPIGEYDCGTVRASYVPRL